MDKNINILKVNFLENRQKEKQTKKLDTYLSIKKTKKHLY